MTNQNEQEWWDDEKYSKLHAGQEFCLVYDIKEIVAEAERRGRADGIKEARKIVRSLQKNPNVYTKGMEPEAAMKMLMPYTTACLDILSELSSLTKK